MTKQLFATVLAAGFLLVPASGADQKIGTVDLRRAFDGYWKTRRADANLKEQAAGLDKDRKQFLENFNKSRDEYNDLEKSATDQAVSATERDKRKNAAEKKLNDLKEQQQSLENFIRSADSTLREKNRRMREDVLKDIRQVISEKAKESGFTLILDVASESVNETPILLFTDGSQDITDDILKVLNTGAPADFLSTPPAETEPGKPAERPLELQKPKKKE